MKRPFWFLCSVLLAALPARADSLWRDPSSDRSMFADKKAYAVGDILTIIVQENSSAEKDNNTTTKKSSAVDASLETFLYSPAGSGLLTHGGQMPALKFDSSHDFNGGGSINNSETIIAKVSVRVVDVLPNKNLVIEGTRHTSFGGEQQDIVLRGVVRPEDITANNTVFSYNVADATVKFVNKGAVTDTQRKGWFTRIWEAITPF
jgi:flagellar L-ring protein precursor FlgH